MQRSRRLLALLLVLVLFVGAVPARAEEQAAPPFGCDHKNCTLEPAAPNEIIITEEAQRPSRATVYHTDEYLAAAELRTAMEQRANTITVYFQMTEMTQESVDYIFNALVKKAIIHTGVGTQGDFLERVYAGWSGNLSYYRSNGIYYSTLTYYMKYYTTAAQEQALTAAVDDFISQNIRSDMTDYEKFRVIYDWICSNVTYDYDTTTNIKYTAYAAMINKTAVCQGYATLLYRLLLEAGIDCRYISGLTDDGGRHGWNIVQMGNYYYNTDATWDAGYAPDSYRWCLLCPSEFKDHNRNSQYVTDEFNALYPMDTASYTPPAPLEDKSGFMRLQAGIVANWNLTGDLYINLNGRDLYGIINTNGYKVYCRDAATDDYTCTNMGSFNCVDPKGNRIVPEPLWLSCPYTPYHTAQYMTIENENGFTSHRFYVGITHISLKPSTESLGYKAVFAGDEMVAEQIDEFGYILQLQGHEPVTVTCAPEDFVSEQPVSLRLSNMDVEHYGETTLCANVYMCINGTVLEGSERETTLRKSAETINANAESYTETQLSLLRKWLSKYAVTAEWVLNNIL